MITRVTPFTQVPACHCDKKGGVCDDSCINRQLYIECAPDICCTICSAQHRTNHRVRPSPNTPSLTSSAPNHATSESANKVDASPAKSVVLSKRGSKRSYCQNTRIQRMDYPDIDIFHTANKGWGLRTMMDLQEGTFVGEYCGEVITKDECEARVKAKAAENNFNLYCATLMGDLVVDAEHYGGYVSSGQG